MRVSGHAGYARRETMNYLLTLYYRDGEGPDEGTPEFDAEMKIWRGVIDEMKRLPGGDLALSP